MKQRKLNGRKMYAQENEIKKSFFLNKFETKAAVLDECYSQNHQAETEN